MNFFVIVVWALSLKMTSFSRAAEVTRPWLLINRLAMVSTGWKMASSATPADPGLLYVVSRLISFSFEKEGWGEGWRYICT